jgi:hypothetical protein
MTEKHPTPTPSSLGTSPRPTTGPSNWPQANPNKVRFLLSILSTFFLNRTPNGEALGADEYYN